MQHDLDLHWSYVLENNGIRPFLASNFLSETALVLARSFDRIICLVKHAIWIRKFHVFYGAAGSEDFGRNPNSCLVKRERSDKGIAQCFRTCQRELLLSSVHE